MLNKKALGPVVAVALLIVVSVVAVVGFQNWFGNYSSGVFSNIEGDSQDFNSVKIEALVGNDLYISGKGNATVNQILVDGNECNISLNVSGTKKVDISDCLSSSNSEIVIVTNEQVISKKVYVEDNVKTQSGNFLDLSGETSSFSTSCNSSPIFNAGDGSLGNPYQICSCSQLQNISQDLAANYVLISDINCNDTVNWNGGKGFNPIDDFTGTFNGQDNEIYDFYINRAKDNVSLFGFINDANISNVGIYVNITGNSKVGGLVGYVNNSNFISNSYSIGVIKGSSSVGGLAGYVGGDNKILKSCFKGSVFGEYWVGGLVGFVSCNSFIVDSYSQGLINGTSSEIGGLLGYNTQISNISQSYSNAIINGSDGVGGLIGSNVFGNIYDSYFTGLVNSGGSAGGLAGTMMNGGSIFNSYSTAPIVSSGGRVGGLLGGAFSYFNISNSYSTGSVTGSATNVGGLIGVLYGPSNITNSHSTGDVFGESNVGGLIGGIYSSNKIENCSAVNEVNGLGNGVGGLAGSFLVGLIINSYSKKSVNGINEVGGLVGTFTGTAFIKNSYSMGVINGSNEVGGITGFMGGNLIQDSYFYGEVNGLNKVGGIVGKMHGIAINNTYSVALVNGVSEVGSLIGFSYSPILTKVYFNNNSNNPSEAVGNGSQVGTFSVLDNESYFYDSTNEPLVFWNSSVWTFNQDSLPVLVWE